MTEKEFRAFLLELLTSGNVGYALNGHIIHQAVEKGINKAKENGWITDAEEVNYLRLIQDLSARVMLLENRNN